jgi:hypothetical protein
LIDEKPLPTALDWEAAFFVILLLRALDNQQLARRGIRFD